MQIASYSNKSITVKNTDLCTLFGFFFFSLRDKLSLLGEPMSACTGTQIRVYLSHLNFHVNNR
jgi:hypothetical protein